MPVRGNKKEFIEKAKLVHGVRYIYDKVNYVDSKTNVEITCRNHGSFMQNRNNHLQGKGCPKCANIMRGRKERSINQRKIGQRIGKCTIVGSNKLTGNKHKFILECDVCSKDSELWPFGSISSSMSNLTSGQVPCGCTLNPRWSKDQRRIQVERKCAEVGYEFLGFIGEWKGYLTKLSLRCKLHGVWESSNIEKLLYGIGCPSCTHKRADKAYINYIPEYGVVKLGVCFDLKRRMDLQRNKNKLEHENIGLWKFSNRDNCIAAELECKRTLETGVLTKLEMPDGYTETTYAYNVDKIISIYERHGGVRV